MQCARPRRAAVNATQARTLNQPDEDRTSGPVERLAPGTMVGAFRTGEMIGFGAQGIVYRGEHLTLGYPVAIKVLHACAADDPRRARFRREARLGAEMRHRNVVSVLEAGELDDGSPFLVMEHVDGVCLANLLGG